MCHSFCNLLIIKEIFFDSICTDTTILLASQWLHYLYEGITIQKGESTRLYNNINGGIGELTYMWFPHNYISKRYFSRSPLVKPDSTTFYECIARDESECSEIDGFRVTVESVTVSESKLLNINIFLNPSNEKIIVSNNCQMRNLDLVV